jgi:oxaloacetate decarboxylase alpha subunit
VGHAVAAAILDRPRAAELAREPDFPTLADLKRRFGAGMDEEEFLLRSVMPAGQVDAMLAAPSSPGTYVPESAPLMKLLRELAARPAVRGLVVETPDLRVALHGGPRVE